MDAMNPKWAAEVCRAAATLLEANRLGRRTEQLRLVADCLDASVPSPNADTIATLSAEVERLRVKCLVLRSLAGAAYRNDVIEAEVRKALDEAARAADKGPEGSA